MSRGFSRTAIRIDGSPSISGYEIRCGRCGEVDKINSNTGNGTLPPEMIANKFRQRGWFVAHKEHKDVCPKCLEAEKKLKRHLESNVVSMVKKEGKVAVDPPREMKREDRRLIFAKIEEVYLDEDHGYSTGWTDNKVASDLGVPLAWVKSIREENFGVEGANEDFRPLLRDTQALLKDIQVQQAIITDRIVEATKIRDDLSNRANHLAGRIAQLEKLFK